MKPLNEIKEIIRDHKTELAEEYGVAEIGVFGSVVRGEAREDSDVDVLVDFSRPIGLMKFMRLEYYLEELFGGTKVDLVSRKALKPYIGRVILQEVQYV
ncbi:nucleotidyltransferase family protein [Geomonas subterranea]|uniref:Nucleotidyltransferase family protein n=1 Tax=Geomonas subterranea TaxID=2847989 RepID=A0ABX8LEG5_9BACT|nr:MULTISPECIES: nucleotidyltransferase family protein [Geomonas]QXE90440.1 nucleotidyltransferase family protein [Geomonas subterranea]QXM11484.1 nucleotidyltransferase family protein [Geomonas subterranea]